MKRLILLINLFILLMCMTSCSININSKQLYTDEFYCRIIDDENIAIGDARYHPESGALFYPEKIEKYTVSQIGISTGLGFGGNGYFHQNQEVILKRLYFPSTIKSVNYGYMDHSIGNEEIFYCGEVIDLARFDKDCYSLNMYVPIKKYDLFKNVLSKYYKGKLLKANVSYHLNYDEDNYYYVDYYENGQIISYIPPDPKRDGHKFNGWFKECECINQWDFNKDIIQIIDGEDEIKLYAKWYLDN